MPITSRKYYLLCYTLYIYRANKRSNNTSSLQFIGTSLLFIYDKDRVGIWLIDFGKTTPIRDLIEGGQITHINPWVRGNYEDGYFFGFTNLLEVRDSPNK